MKVSVIRKIGQHAAALQREIEDACFLYERCYFMTRSSEPLTLIKTQRPCFLGFFFAVITDFLVGNYDGDRQLRPLIKRAVMVIYGF